VQVKVCESTQLGLFLTKEKADVYIDGHTLPWIKSCLISPIAVTGENENIKIVPRTTEIKTLNWNGHQFSIRRSKE
jgi:hypothetical protein